MKKKKINNQMGFSTILIIAITINFVFKYINLEIQRIIVVIAIFISVVTGIYYITKDKKLEKIWGALALCLSFFGFSVLGFGYILDNKEYEKYISIPILMMIISIVAFFVLGIYGAILNKKRKKALCQ